MSHVIGHISIRIVHLHVVRTNFGITPYNNGAYTTIVRYQ